MHDERFFVEEELTYYRCFEPMPESATNVARPDADASLESALRRLATPVFAYKVNEGLRPVNRAASELAEIEDLPAVLVRNSPAHPITTALATVLASDNPRTHTVSAVFPSGRHYELELSERSSKGGLRWTIILIRPILANGSDRLKAVCTRYGFTEREREVTALLLTGKSSEQICNELRVSRHTLKAHLRHIFAKTEVRNRTQLLAQLFS